MDSVWCMLANSQKVTTQWSYEKMKKKKGPVPWNIS